MTPDSYYIAVLAAALLITWLGWGEITGTNRRDKRRWLADRKTHDSLDKLRKYVAKESPGNSIGPVEHSR